MAQLQHSTESEQIASRTNEDLISVVVPLYNEEDNVKPLIERIQSALESAPFGWELILVNDGSHDRTLDRALELAKQIGEHIRVVALQRNYGQTAAMQAGIELTRGGIIVTMDGDLQNDPADIPAMVTELKRRDLDLLQGWRQDRQDDLVMRKIPSRLANKLISKVTGVALHDNGCSLKVYRGDVIRQVKLYGEMHRFIPAWVAIQVPRHRIGEMPVNHHARTAGESKYGLSRVYRVLLDLLIVSFFMKYRARPGHFFGAIGLGMGGLGGLMMFWLFIEKFFNGENIGDRPMLMVAILMILASVQLMTTAVLAEIMSRTYFESSGVKSFLAAEVSPQREGDQGWFFAETPAESVQETDAEDVS